MINKLRFLSTFKKKNLSASSKCHTHTHTSVFSKQFLSNFFFSWWAIYIFFFFLYICFFFFFEREKKKAMLCMMNSLYTVYGYSVYYYYFHLLAIWSVTPIHRSHQSVPSKDLGSKLERLFIFVLRKFFLFLSSMSYPLQFPLSLKIIFLTHYIYLHVWIYINI